MAPFDADLTPVALPGEAVRVVPEERVYQVAAVEQMARVGPVDYGSATSGSSPTESGSSIIDLDDELEMDTGTLGQFWINPLSDVEVEVRQTGQQEQRFVNANQTGVITPRTPANQRVVYVYEGETPYLIITNPQTWDMDKTLVYYTGYKFHLGGELNDGEVNGLRGEPATIPTDSLKRYSPGGVA